MDQKLIQHQEEGTQTVVKRQWQWQCKLDGKGTRVNSVSVETLSGWCSYNVDTNRMGDDTGGDVPLISQY